MNKNEDLTKAEEKARNQVENERKKFKQLKEVRKQEKKQIRQLFQTFVDMIVKGKPL